ncbi:11414_t:CDS:2 [Entrophospora sp. SA101]|nr:11414_t:CDS:2 [Entrophospora sp. SA101]
MSIDKRIDNAALSPTSIVQIFDNDTNNSSSIMQIPDINNSIQIHDIMLKCRICAATYSGIGKTSTAQHPDILNHLNPDENDWLKINELIDVLSPFYSATLLLSSSNYSTIGEFHFTLWTLVKNLHKQIEVSNTQYIVANSILYKLEQYFKLPDEAKMIASLLDPSTKSTTFTTDEITRTVTAIKPPSQIIKNRIDARTHIRSLASQFLPTNNTHTNDEVEKYLLLAKENECNPLMWWCTYKETFPFLSELAKDYLAIQSTSVPCEQSFSVTGLTISKLRNRLDPETSRECNNQQYIHNLI